MNRRLLSAVLVLCLAASPALAAQDTIAYSELGVLQLITPDGTVQPVEGARGFEPTWFDGGDALAFVDEAGISSVQVEDSSSTTRLVTDDAVGTLDVSPDGLYIAYSRTEPDSAISIAVLFENDVVDGGVEIDFPGAGFIDESPRWSPDGQHLAFSRLDRRTGQNQAMLFRLGPDFPDSYSSPTPLVGLEQFTTTSPPSWTPDGRHVVVAAIPRPVSPGDTPGIYEVAVDGSGTRQVWDNPEGLTITDLAVSPDAQRVAVSSLGLDVLPLDASGPAAFSVDIGDDRPVTLGWTADSQSLIAETVFDDSGCSCLLSTVYAIDTAQPAAPVALIGLGAEEMELREGPLNVTPNPGVTRRLAGASRVETALQVSRATFEDADTVVIARSDVYADALAGAGLAGAVDGPLLLSPPDRIPDNVADEIGRLGATELILLGDESALAPGVEDVGLDGSGGDGIESVRRLSGPNRYATAAAVAAELSSTTGYVVQGAAADPQRGWPDAVATSGLAATEGAPVFLVEQDRLPAETAQAITDNELTDLTIVGGEAAVSVEVEQQLLDLGVTIDRLAGGTRYETSALVAEATEAAGADGGEVWLSTGANWPDSLAAGPAVAHEGGVLLLVDGRMGEGGVQTPIDAATTAYLAQRDVTRATLIGTSEVMGPHVRLAVDSLDGP